MGAVSEAAKAHTRAYNREYCKTHREQRRLHALKKRHENPGRQLAYCYEHRRRNPERYLFLLARRRAKKKGLPFEIGMADIKIPATCPYLGIPLKTTGQGVSKDKLNCASLDRIDSTKGYVPGNVRVISWLANAMKNAATIEQVLTFSKNALKIHSLEGHLNVVE